MADLIREGELNRHLLRLRRACLERRDCIVESLGKALGDRVSFASPTGGMALWLRPARGHPDLWCEGALSRRVLLGSATKFTFPGQPVQAGLRLGYAAHDPVALREIACRLAEVATEISV